MAGSLQAYYLGEYKTAFVYVTSTWRYISAKIIEIGRCLLMLPLGLHPIMFLFGCIWQPAINERGDDDDNDYDDDDDDDDHES